MSRKGVNMPAEEPGEERHQQAASTNSNCKQPLLPALLCGFEEIVDGRLHNQYLHSICWTVNTLPSKLAFFQVAMLSCLHENVDHTLINIQCLIDGRKSWQGLDKLFKLV